ncbi:MAG TPA: metal-sensitive transcriptional regulator [Fimbriimonadaceae bacterium]|nr:metal-sensitive transcriptional regulator [Fimbriimonadaceae bacterium]
MTSQNKEDAKLRLSRMSGQVQGISKMVEEERYCVDILTQVASLRAALEQFGSIMLSMHIEECVYGDAQNGAFEHLSGEERMEEVRLTLSRFLK